MYLLMSRPHDHDRDRIVRMAAVDGVLDDLPIYRPVDRPSGIVPQPPDFDERVVWRFIEPEEAKTGEIDGEVNRRAMWSVSCRVKDIGEVWRNFYSHLTYQEAVAYLETGVLPE